MDPKRSGTGNDARSVQGTGRFLGAGIQFAASIVLFVFVGQWLDERLGTEPWLLLLGVFVGAAAGFHSLYRHLVSVPRERERTGDGKKGE